MPTDWDIYCSLHAIQVRGSTIGGIAAPRHRGHTNYADLDDSMRASQMTSGWHSSPRAASADTQWTSDPTEQTHIRRRFMLLGQTLDGMRVWDIRRAVQAVRAIDGLGSVPLTLIGGAAKWPGIALYAALFEPQIESVALHHASRVSSHRPRFPERAAITRRAANSRNGC